ncbi:MAG: hypothetical protein VBE63_19795 [Lamprobacter sp.]|uniref:hypothetical protein n=1 Tax=Lamprobacter sp. TaxID=3100796 RepID=UPI002B26253A|nr:hypothetical protein [Lamprobacter sp.]MEA3642161.1 hypothetical protein [Lamprobacter sp.]
MQHIIAGGCLCCELMGERTDGREAVIAVSWVLSLAITMDHSYTLAASIGYAEQLIEKASKGQLADALRLLTINVGYVGFSIHCSVSDVSWPPPTAPAPTP